MFAPAPPLFVADLMGISALNGAHDGRATPVFHRAPFLALFNLDDVVEREVL